MGGARPADSPVQVAGRIRLIGARIDGSLDLTGAHIESSDGPAIDLADATIESSVFLIEDLAGRRPVIRGRFDLGSARISGRLLIHNATVEARVDAPTGSIYARSTATGTALSAARLSVGDVVMLAEAAKLPAASTCRWAT